MEDTTTTGFWLSPQQKHAWMRQDPRTPRNSLLVLQIDGPLDTGRVRHALEEVAARHEILHTALRRHPGMKLPFQVVLENCAPAWQTLDLRGEHAGLEAVLDDERRFAFVLDRGPVMRAALCVLGSEAFVLVLTLPALLSDAYTLRRIARDLGLFYSGAAAELPEDTLRYVQLAQWQNELLESEEEDAREAKQFWGHARQAGGTLQLPGLRKDRIGAFRLEHFNTTLAPSTLASVEALAAKHRASISDVLLSSWQSFLSRIAGQTEFAVSVSFEGRNYAELEPVLGPVAKTAPVPARLSGNPSAVEVLEAVRDAVREAADRVEYFSPEATDTLPVGYEYSENEVGETRGGVKFTLLRVETAGEPYALRLTARRQGGTLTLGFEYDAGQLHRAAVERWSGEFQTLLTAALTSPNQPVSRLPLLPESERRQILVDWNRTEAAYPETRCFHELFEEQAARTPESPAVRCAGKQLSYRELNEEANQLAHRLRDLGVGPDSRVGLCLERSAELLVGVLAILKAGGAYVPVQPEHPAARLAQQLQGTAAVLTESKLAPALPQTGGPVICMDTERALWQTLPRTNPPPSARPENLAYVIYTSGSTGVPKGVLVRHRNLVNYAWFIREILQLDRQNPPWQCASVSTLSADLGNTCIYPALLAGGCVHLIEPEMAADSRALGQYFTAQKVDVLKIVPSHLRALLDAGGGRDMLPRRCLILGGEPLSRALAERIEALGAGCEIVNHYGPTETTVGSLLLRLGQYDWRAGEAAGIPIGRPIANTRVYILDSQQQPVPIGVAGELYLGGAGVTAGYLEQPEQTAARFVPDPFQPGERLYRTGDRGRYLADGQVEFLGRLDEQVKIRGYRVEPGEAEAAIARHPGVRQAVVLARAGQAGEDDKQLAAYVVPRPEAGLTVDELRRCLKAALPDYLVPAVLVLLPKLPLTANGKLDRQALPALEAAASKTQLHEPPQTPVEQSLADIWTQLLRRERIGRQENFFDIGGHSLLATQVVSRIRQQFRLDLAVRTLFDHPTIALLAAAMDAADPAEAAEEAELVPVSREAYRVRFATSTSRP